MSARTPMEKLEGVRTELTILLPRLTPEFRKGIEASIQWLKEVEADLAHPLVQDALKLTKKENGNGKRK